jgi:hypothetical protein
MRKTVQKPWLPVAALAVGAAITWRAVKSYRERQFLLQYGDFRELYSVWVNRDSCRVHTSISTAAARSAISIVLLHGWAISGS